MASLLNMSGGSLLNKGLPYDAEVEYLESSGTQYIDTGICATNTTRAELGLRIIRIIIRTGIFGTFEAPKSFYIYNSSEGYLQTGFGQYTAQGYNGNNTQYFDILFDNFSVYRNGVKIISFTPMVFTNTVSLVLFSMNRANSTLYSGCPIELYYCKLFKDDILVRDFIPVRVGTTGYMYDKVSGQLFGNAGTGDFILGPDK